MRRLKLIDQKAGINDKLEKLAGDSSTEARDEEKRLQGLLGNLDKQLADLCKFCFCFARSHS